MTQAKHTPLPWRLDYTPGRECNENDYVPDDCEPYNLAEATIVCPSEFGGGHQYNPETKKWDIPVPLEIVSLSFDDRPKEYNRPETHLANMRLIVTAVNNYGRMREALEDILYVYQHNMGIHEDKIEKAKAILAETEGM